MRRRPIYLLVGNIETADYASESLKWVQSLKNSSFVGWHQYRELVEADRSGSEVSVGRDQVHLSVIRFGQVENRHSPLKPIYAFDSPPIEWSDWEQSNPDLDLADALEFTDSCIRKEVRGRTETTTGDWKPFVFIIGCWKRTNDWIYYYQELTRISEVFGNFHFGSTSSEQDAKFSFEAISRYLDYWEYLNGVEAPLRGPDPIYET